MLGLRSLWLASQFRFDGAGAGDTVETHSFLHACLLTDARPHRPHTLLPTLLLRIDRSPICQDTIIFGVCVRARVSHRERPRCRRQDQLRGHKHH